MSSITSSSQSSPDAQVSQLSVGSSQHQSVLCKPKPPISLELLINPNKFQDSSITNPICNSPNFLSISSEEVLLENPTSLAGEYSLLSPTQSSKPGSAMDTIAHMHPVVKSFLIGSISGTCSTVIFQPLDLVKTRLQHPVGRTNGMIAVVGNIVRNENLIGLWRGMTPSLTRCVPGVGLYFGSIHGLKIFFDINSEPTAIQSILLGATARTISGVTMIPFTVIKTRFESKVYQYGSISEALSLIYKREGIRGLTCGLLPTLLRDAPFSALYLMMYTWTKQAVPKEWADSNFSPILNFSCGISAGIGASLVTQPFDVVKTKMQLFPDRFHSIPPVIVYIYEKYGMKGYFKGLMPRMVRRTLIAAMSWTVYEQLMRNIGLK